MDEVSKLREGLRSCGIETRPTDRPDEFAIQLQDVTEPAILVADAEGLERYLASTEKTAVEAYGDPSNPRERARSLLLVNLTEMFDTRYVHRVGIQRDGTWIEESSPWSPATADVDPDGTYEWRAERLEEDL